MKAIILNKNEKDKSIDVWPQVGYKASVAWLSSRIVTYKPTVAITPIIPFNSVIQANTVEKEGIQKLHDNKK